ncbi:hypothetical protein BGZ63DRAFT_386687 [Mariannaea sp. PMI_226]|nr:hypothetical protein BGZ63DRAFT_386687 [Mariannaea sp. PMI_226]
MKRFSSLAYLALVRQAISFPTVITRRDVPDPFPYINAGDKTYLNRTCTDPGVVDANMDQGIRWDDLNCNEAMYQVFAGFNLGTNVNLPFVEFLSNAFHGPEGWDCQKIDNQACTNTLLCTDVTVPAAYDIMNSIATLHSLLQSGYNELNVARSDLEFSLPTFMSTFCPVIPPDLALEIFKSIIDVVGFAAGMGSAFFWNKLATRLLTLGGEDRGWAKDSFNTGIALILNLSKDNLNQPKTDLDKQNLIEDQANVFFEFMMQTFVDFNNEVFSGKGDWMAILRDILMDGKFMPNTNLGIDADEYKANMKAIVYAAMIPKAWKLHDSDARPIILETQDPCDSDERTSYISQLIDDDVAKKTRTCIDGSYVYLVNLKPGGFCSPNPNLACPRGTFEALPGGTNDVLDGTQWGSLTLADLVTSVKTGYTTYGNTNNYSLDPNAMAPEDPLDFYNSNIMPGFVQGLWWCPLSQTDTIKKAIDPNPPNNRPDFWPCF